MAATVIPVWRGPAPMPREASLAAQRLIALANLVPAGMWVSYGDLADAYITKHGENMVARGVASALSLLPVDTYVEERNMVDPQPRVDKWPVPWHRIRLADGRAVARKYGAVDSNDYLNQMLAAEGGTFRHGSATDRCRFYTVVAVRTSKANRPPGSSELTAEQRQRLADRAADRRYRLDG